MMVGDVAHPVIEKRIAETLERQRHIVGRLCRPSPLAAKPGMTSVS